jgi:hypothetical protein
MQLLWNVRIVFFDTVESLIGFRYHQSEEVNLQIPLHCIEVGLGIFTVMFIVGKKKGS